MPGPDVQWIVESFARHRVTYKHPTIRRKGRDGKMDHVYVSRSLAYLEAGVLFRTGAIRILDDSTTARELRNLEQRGDKVDHPSGYHDDRGNVLCLAAVMAYEGRRRSGSFALSFSWSRPADSQLHIGRTLEYLTEPLPPRETRDVMAEAQKQREEARQRAKEQARADGHDIEDPAHRVTCHACRAAWKADVTVNQGLHQVTTPQGRQESYYDPRGLEGAAQFHATCRGCWGSTTEAAMLAMQREHLIGFQPCRDKALGFTVNGRTMPAPDLPQDLPRTEGEWTTAPSLNGDPSRL